MDIQMKCMSVTVRSLFIIRMLYIVVLMFLIIQIKFISVSYDRLRFFFSPLYFCMSMFFQSLRLLL